MAVIAFLLAVSLAMRYLVPTDALMLYSAKGTPAGSVNTIRFAAAVATAILLNDIVTVASVLALAGAVIAFVQDPIGAIVAHHYRAAAVLDCEPIDNASRALPKDWWRRRLGIVPVAAPTGASSAATPAEDSSAPPSTAPVSGDRANSPTIPQ